MINWTEEEYQGILAKKNTPTSVKHALESSEPKKTSKYHNKKTKVSGVCFDSLKESEYFVTLEYAVRNKVILGYILQPKFLLQEGNEDMKPIFYVADFLVFNKDGYVEIWDIKPSKDFLRRFIQVDLYQLYRIHGTSGRYSKK